MGVEGEELLRLARLAGLALDPGEEAVTGGAVARLIAFGETLAGAGAGGGREGAEPDAFEVPEAVLEARRTPAPEAGDVAGECLPRTAVEANAPAAAGGLVRVPPLGAWRR